ncbi:MAG: tRNA (adenosine(37)-N6)-dimethylallyltransferase MiaA [Clostridia bacterium]|nr:tRNA (adenosine(37)-N6)-dimethylallyltransferase MiaA [Clostridia bacterium]
MNGKVIVVGGPTASGKSDLAVRLAKKYGGEVISADALLVYKGLNIGTAKPTKEEMQDIPHHLIDVMEPTQNFSVSDYERLALPVLEDILSRGKTAIVCGGTGFYIKALLFKSQFGNTPQNQEIREKYKKIAQEKGNTYLHNLLKACDKESAEKLHENDTKRVIRALEIFELTGKKKSEQQDKEIARYPYTAYAVDFPRETLYERINRRVDLMFELGLLDEVKGLISLGIDENCQCMQAIGYKEVYEDLQTGASVAQMKELIQKNTRNYAKRQITFFKKFPLIEWIDKDTLL